jgi:hypothetical protein
MGQAMAQRQEEMSQQDHGKKKAAGIQPLFGG